LDHSPGRNVAVPLSSSSFGTRRGPRHKVPLASLAGFEEVAEPAVIPGSPGPFHQVSRRRYGQADHPSLIRVCTELEVAEPAVKPGSVLDSHSSRRNVAVTLKQPTRTRRGPRHEVPIWPCSRWGLPCHAALAPHAVRSYRTISPLPRTSEDAVRRFAFCCTSRRLAPPRHYLAPCPVEPGLSSAPLRMTRLSGRLRRGHGT